MKRMAMLIYVMRLILFLQLFLLLLLNVTANIVDDKNDDDQNICYLSDIELT